jgi:hypothetical protein
MKACEPRVRRRGFFLHSDTTGEPGTGDYENPEGFGVRVHLSRHPFRGQIGRISAGGRARAEHTLDDTAPQFRSGNGTGSRQRSHSLR